MQGPVLKLRLRSQQTDHVREWEGRWQAREDTLSGELGWEGGGKDREPKPPSPGRASCVTIGASGPHQQLPRAAWELREVDMEQKQH